MQLLLQALLLLMSGLPVFDKQELSYKHAQKQNTTYVEVFVAYAARTS